MPPHPAGLGHFQFLQEYPETATASATTAMADMTAELTTAPFRMHDYANV